jgi:DNA-binding GntR family transcriptional regulator
MALPDRTPLQESEDSGLSDPIYARICQRLRSDILNGTLAPGQRLKITDLIKRYHVSQMPIREALQQLQGEWLVTISPNRGASVRKVDEIFIGDMYEIRAHLESLLSRRCAELAPDEEIVKLVQLGEEWEAAAGSPGSGLNAIMQANRNIHRSIYRLAKNQVGTELLDRHFGLLSSLRSIYGFCAERLASVVIEHRELLEAIRQRNGQRAEEAARRHCLAARDDLLTRMRAAKTEA